MLDDFLFSTKQISIEDKFPNKTKIEFTIYEDGDITIETVSPQNNHDVFCTDIWALMELVQKANNFIQARKGYVKGASE